MAGLTAVVDMIAAIGAAARSTSKDLADAARVADDYKESVKKAATAGMTGTQGSTPGALATALQAQIGRR